MPRRPSSPQLGTWTFDAATERITVEYINTTPPSMGPLPDEPRYVRIDPPNAIGTWTSTDCMIE